MRAPLLARSKPASPRLLASMVVLFLGLGIGGVWWFVSKAASNVAADLNNDAKVDVLDLSALLTNWAGTGTSTRGDINSDSAVNIFDLSLLLAGWGSNSTATIPAGGALVTVDAASNAGAWKVALSFGHFWSDGVNEPTQNAASYVKWAAYNPPPVRVSTRGYPTGGIPKIGGVWNFAHLDAMITIDRQSSQAAPMVNLSEIADDIPCVRTNAGFAVMGQYFARIVSYYNTGSMVTETGATITNPYGTANKITYWELFNEPSIMPDCGLMTPDEYASMFNVVAPLMKAVDPTIKIMGPVDNEHNSTSHDYISTLMAIANTPDIISTHHYAGNNSRSDHYLMTSLAPGGEIWGQLERAYQVAPDRPHWLTEANISYEGPPDDPAGRPWGALGQVWNAELFRIAAQFGVEMIQTYNWSQEPQFGMVNRSSGVTNRSYWRNLLIHRYFPVGTTTLNTSTTMPDGITSMAVKEADGTVNILLINKRLENTTVNGGTGIATDVALSVRGKSINSINMQKIDASSSPTTEPPVVSLSTTDPVVQFSGYGIALIKID